MATPAACTVPAAVATPARQLVLAYAAFDSSSLLLPFTFSRRTPTADDVTFRITHCGVCHTDLHAVRNDYGFPDIYPLVPGHELVGIVTEVGSNVKRFKIGDRVGVGTLVNSCRTCESCTQSMEQLCRKKVPTYGGKDVDGTRNFGGYSSLMVAKQSFVFRIPDQLPLDAAAPLLCAGITVYSPMKRFGMCEKGKHLGVVGLGGLGHMAVKFGKAFGLEVTVISTSPSKEMDARELLGADHFLISKEETQMQKAQRTMDYIIDTISASHSIEPELSLLKPNGILVMLGVPVQPLALPVMSLVTANRCIAGSNTGGIRETQEMLDFCGCHNITCTIEKIPMQYINQALDRLQKADVKYRFVIDIADTLKAEE